MVTRRAHRYKAGVLVANTGAIDTNRNRRARDDKQGDQTKRLPTRYRALRYSRHDVMLGIKGLRFYKPIFDQLTGNGPSM